MLFNAHRRCGALLRVLVDSRHTPRSPMLRITRHILAIEENATRVTWEDASNGAQQRRLPGPIRADDARKVPCCELQVDML